MKINRIQPNYSIQNNVQQKSERQQSEQNYSSQVSFKSGIGDQIMDSLKQKGAIKFMKGLEWLKGESGGILITAIGTGFVAPWFIAFNPFVKAKPDATKEEKKELQNTKLYTAMRQIVSMAIAIVTQLGILIPIDRLWDSLVNKKEYSKNFRVNIDQSDLNTKSFIERNVKKQLKEEGVKAPSFKEIFTDGWKSYKANREEFKAIVKKKVSAEQNLQIEKVAKTFAETGQMKASGRAIDNKSVAELINKQIEEYISDAKKLQINEKGLNFYSDRAKTLMENESYIKKMFEKIPEDKTEFKTFLENLHAKEQNPKIKEILKEIIERPEDIQKSRIDRTLARIDKIKELCDGKYTEEGYLKALKDRNSALDEVIEKLNSKKIVKTAEATAESIKQSIKEVIEACSFKEENGVLKSVMKATDTFDSDISRLTKKVNKDTTKLYKKLIENNYKSINQISKVLVGVLITLPISCNLLNWIYPRFMEIFFPRLAGVKKGNEEGGKKCQA